MSRLGAAFREAGASIRSRVLSGVVVLVPLLLTAWVIRLVFNVLDGWLRPLETRLLRHYIPGTGLLATVILLYFVGLIVTNLGGKTLVGWTEKLLMRLPLIGDVYGSSKQIMQAVSNPKGLGFRRVVSLEFPRPGVRAIGFVTQELVSPGGGRDYTVFLPTVPNPTTGFLLVIPADQVEELDMNMDEAVKMLVSGGIVMPEAFRAARLQARPVAGSAPAASANRPPDPAGRDGSARENPGEQFSVPGVPES